MEDVYMVGARIAEIDRIIATTKEDGFLYEDEYIVVYREHGLIFFQGKPIRIPLVFREA